MEIASGLGLQVGWQRGLKKGGRGGGREEGGRGGEGRGRGEGGEAGKHGLGPTFRVWGGGGRGGGKGFETGLACMFQGCIGLQQLSPGLSGFDMVISIEL